MAAIENVIRAIIVGDPAVSALIATRLYPVRLAQGAAFPAVSYFVVDEITPIAHSGYVSVTFARLQFTLHTTNYEQMQALSTAIKAALNGVAGVYSGLRIHFVHFQMQLDNDPNLEALSTQQYQRYIDFRIAHSVADAALRTEGGAGLLTEDGAALYA